MNGRSSSACCEMAAFCGRNFLWTQGGGGNVSCIDGDTLRIKRSGLRLRDMRTPEDLVPLPVGAVRELFFSNAPDMDERLERLAPSVMGGPSVMGAPSVEAFFHALLGPWTAHAHLVSATALVSRSAAPDALVERLSKELGVFCTWIPYASPGSALAREVHAKLPAAVPALGVLLLRNHGAVVWGPEPEVVKARFDQLDVASRALLGAPGLPVIGPAPLQAGAFDPAGTELSGPLVSDGTGSLDSPQGRAAVAALRAPWTPDAALHFGHGLEPVEGALPALGRLFLRDQRLFYACARPDFLENATEILSAQLTAWHWNDGDLSCLTPEQTDGLLRWGAGKYGTVAK